MPRKSDFDVIIVGARCAGAATARLLADAGLDVLLVDRADPGCDTLSSHTMTRGAVSQLSRWGLLPKIVASGTPAINRSIFRFGADEVAIDIRPLADGPGMVAPRRFRLDTMLARAAVEAGAEMRFRTALREVIRDGYGRVCGALLTGPDGCDRVVTADLVIGADGLRSSVARRVRAPEVPMATHALGHVYAYFELPEQIDNLGVFAPGLSIGLTPTDDGMTTVIVSAAPERLRAAIRDYGADAALIRLASEIDQDLGARLAAARQPERARVFAGRTGMRRRATGPGWALIGDAGQFRDPVTSHGMTDAFRDAEHIARCLLETGPSLPDFEAERNAVSDPVFALTAELARFDHSMAELKQLFIRLSTAAREEQRWMSHRFGQVAIAA